MYESCEFTLSLYVIIILADREMLSEQGIHATSPAQGFYLTISFLCMLYCIQYLSIL